MIHLINDHSELDYLLGKEWMTVVLSLPKEKKREVYEWIEEETCHTVLILRVPRQKSPGVSVQEPYTYEYMGRSEFIFESIDEALTFKLTWGGK